MRIRNEYLKKLIMLDKIYKDDNKFCDIGDNFNFKFIILFNKCRQVGLPKDAYIQVASIMLLGQASIYYYANYGNNSIFAYFVLTCSYFCKVLSGNVWILSNNRLLASIISS